jgi:hypothetical protein
MNEKRVLESGSLVSLLLWPPSGWILVSRQRMKAALHSLGSLAKSVFAANQQIVVVGTLQMVQTKIQFMFQFVLGCLIFLNIGKLVLYPFALGWQELGTHICMQSL